MKKMLLAAVAVLTLGGQLFACGCMAGRTNVAKPVVTKTVAGR
jgi:hypothetical protein